MIGATATEAYQSSWYLQMLDLVSCDPNVKLVDIYHLLDEAALSGWQSGLYYVDQTPKLSSATVHDWIATTGGACRGASAPVDAARGSRQGATGAHARSLDVGPADRRLLRQAGPRLRRSDTRPSPRDRPLRPGLRGPVGGRGRRREPRRRRRLRGGQGRQVKILNGKSGGLLTTYTVAARLGRARRRERRRPRRPRRRDEGPGEGVRREDACAARDADAVRLRVQGWRDRGGRRPLRATGRRT